MEVKLKYFSKSLCALLLCGLIVFLTACSENNQKDDDNDSVHKEEVFEEEVFEFLTQENIDFLKSVEGQINIYALCTEKEYDCTTDSSYNMAYFAAEQHFVDLNAGNAAYYAQTVEILKDYEKCSDSISLEFIDLNLPGSAEITKKFNKFDFEKCDILVESISKTADGDEVAKHAVVDFEDIYTLGNEEKVEQWKHYAAVYGNYALYGQGAGYSIDANNLETALSNAIYSIAMSKTIKYLVPISYYAKNDKGIIVDEYLKDMLTDNNYELKYVEGNLSSIMLNEYDGIILAGCQKDISPTDYENIYNFLDNNGQRGKSFIYFADVDVKSKMPQLSVLLADWGIGFQDGILYETDQSNRVIIDETGDPTEFLHSATESELLKDVYINSFFVAGGNVPMNVLYSKSGDRTTDLLMRTGSFGTTTVMPSGENSKQWKPSADVGFDAFPTVIATVDEQGEDKSYVVAFASTDFIVKEWVENYTSVVNDEFVLDVFDAISLRDTKHFSFEPKVIKHEAEAPTETPTE